MGCMALPDRAPLVYVPSKTPEAHKPLTLAFPHVHYCETHWNEDMKLSDFLDQKARAKFEAQAKRIRPHDFTCNFEAALIVPIDVFSPEYRAYMERIGLKADGIGWAISKPLARALAGHP